MSVKILKYREHANADLDEEEVFHLSKKAYTSFFKKRKEDLPCYAINDKGENENPKLETGYFIGVDWLDINRTAIYVAPKLNVDNKEIDFTKMLFDSLRHSDISKEIDE